MIIAPFNFDPQRFESVDGPFFFFRLNRYSALLYIEALNPLPMKALVYKVIGKR
jgi:hypothetical protein